MEWPSRSGGPIGRGGEDEPGCAQIQDVGRSGRETLAKSKPLLQRGRWPRHLGDLMRAAWGLKGRNEEAGRNLTRQSRRIGEKRRSALGPLWQSPKYSITTNYGRYALDRARYFWPIYKKTLDFSKHMLNASINPERALCTRRVHNTMRIMYIYLPSHDQASNAHVV